MRNQPTHWNHLQKRVEGHPLLLRMPTILRTLRVRLLLMKFFSWEPISPLCTCSERATYQLDSKWNSTLPTCQWTASKMDWRGSGRANRQIYASCAQKCFTWNFMAIYFINLYFSLFHFFLFWHSFQFQQGMNTARSNSSSCICLWLGPWNFSYHPELFMQPTWRLDHCPELVGWVQPPNQAPFYNPFTPILYYNYQGCPDIKALFLNKVLFDVSSLFAH